MSGSAEQRLDGGGRLQAVAGDRADDGLPRPELAAVAQHVQRGGGQRRGRLGEHAGVGQPAQGRSEDSSGSARNRPPEARTAAIACAPRGGRATSTPSASDGSGTTSAGTSPVAEKSGAHAALCTA